MNPKSSEYSCKNWKYYLLLEDSELLALCEQSFIKGSGRGGQKRNKSSNGVRLALFHFRAIYDNSRSLKLNQAYALRALRLQIALDLTPSYKERPKPEQSISDLSSSVMLVKKTNSNFAYCLALLIDHFIFQQGDYKALAQRINQSSSQLNRWITGNGYKPYFNRLKAKLTDETL